MKKIVFIIVFALAFLKVNAQTQFDTVVFHPYDLSDCPMGLGLESYSFKSVLCDSCPTMGVYPCTIRGNVTGRNQYGVQAVAQPYHFDSTVSVIGIAIRIYGTMSTALYNSIFLRIMDETFNDLAQTPLYPWSIPDSNGYMRHFFNNVISVKDFYLSGDIPSYQSDFHINYPATWSMYDSTGCLEHVFKSRGLPYDTIFVGINYHNPDPWATVTDTLVACIFDESPWLKKDDKWIKFAEDTVYSIFQKTYIEFLPILKIAIPDTLSLVEEINIDNTFSVFPNPADNTINVSSQNKINKIEIYNILGVKLSSETINNTKATLDVSNLKSGNYILKLHTVKGIASKKFVIK